MSERSKRIIHARPAYFVSESAKDFTCECLPHKLTKDNCDTCVHKTVCKFINEIGHEYYTCSYYQSILIK